MSSITQESLASDLPSVVVELCQRLRKSAASLDLACIWPREQLQWCAQAGVFRWFIPEAYGGLGWSERQVLHGYLALSQSCLTTTFILTQWNAACRRIMASDNAEQRQQLLPHMASGQMFATVGISHLTTSRQHLGKPVLSAQPQPDGGFILQGYSPWVTGAASADVIVVGATLIGEGDAESRQVLCVVPRGRAGLEAGTGQPLVALTSSCTDQIALQEVIVYPSEVLAGPVENVMQLNSGGGAGGLQTSALAVGLTFAAVELIREQAERRGELRPIFEKLAADAEALRTILIALTCGESATMDASELRRQVNSLVLRATQAALSAAKGAGFVADHPAGRLAREALFFLVWSCPQPVVTANLCEFAQLG
jgi:alkylation response protein AidB-like acyl-CoA dehydrogenase